MTKYTDADGHARIGVHGAIETVESYLTAFGAAERGELAAPGRGRITVIQSTVARANTDYSPTAGRLRCRRAGRRDDRPILLRFEHANLAKAQVRAAEQWWRQNRLKAPNAIREELERAAVLISRIREGRAGNDGNQRVAKHVR